MNSRTQIEKPAAGNAAAEGGAWTGKKTPHPKAWVRRMVAARGLEVPEKTLYWWSIHLERFLVFCRKLGREASGNADAAAEIFLESIRGTTARQAFAADQ